MKNVEFLPIHDNCQGCIKTVKDDDKDFRRCKAYINPSYWWIQGRTCPLRPKGELGISDIASMAAKEGVFKVESGMFVFNGRKIAKNIGGLTQFLKSDKNALVSIKKFLGITDGDEEHKRVGQQKQKKNRKP